MSVAIHYWINLIFFKIETNKWIKLISLNIKFIFLYFLDFYLLEAYFSSKSIKALGYKSCQLHQNSKVIKYILQEMSSQGSKNSRSDFNFPRHKLSKCRFFSNVPSKNAWKIKLLFKQSSPVASLCPKKYEVTASTVWKNAKSNEKYLIQNQGAIVSGHVLISWTYTSWASTK